MFLQLSIKFKLFVSLYGNERGVTMLKLVCVDLAFKSNGWWRRQLRYSSYGGTDIGADEPKRL